MRSQDGSMMRQIPLRFPSWDIKMNTPREHEQLAGMIFTDSSCWLFSPSNFMKRTSTQKTDPKKKTKNTRTWFGAPMIFWGHKLAPPGCKKRAVARLRRGPGHLRPLPRGFGGQGSGMMTEDGKWWYHINSGRLTEHSWLENGPGFEDVFPIDNEINPLLC